MKNIILFLVIVSFGLAVTAQETTQKIDELLSAWVKNEKFNGTALVVQNGNTVLQKGYGLKNAATKELNDGNTIFQIGSITKQFTSAIILRLQENKKLSIHDKLSKYFPALPFAEKVSIENLLSHTSGIYNYTNDGDFMKTEAVKPATHEKLLALFKDKPLEFEPGSRFSYSNSNYILLGFIIEKISGKPYEQVVHEMIFGPLHMDHSGFDFASLRSADKAVGYFALSASSATVAGIVDSSVSYAAGAIYTTAADLLKWDRALYTEKIISKSSLKDAYSIRKGNYGLGWTIDSAYGRQVYQHGGGIFGFTSFIFRNPEENSSIFLFDNKGDGSLEKIAAGINAILHNKPYELPRERIANKIDTATVKQFLGEYELMPGFILTITLEDGKLMVQATGQGKAELYEEKPNFFFLKVADVQVEFLKNDSGVTDKLILHQGGRATPAKKIK